MPCSFTQLKKVEDRIRGYHLRWPLAGTISAHCFSSPPMLYILWLIHHWKKVIPLVFHTFRPECVKYNYLSNIKDFNQKRLYSKLRTRNQKLEIEHGRYTKIPREERYSSTSHLNAKNTKIYVK